MLRSYDQSSILFTTLTAIAGIFLGLTSLGVFRSDRSVDANAPGKESRGLPLWFAFACALFVISGRWPYLLFRRYFNPDESQQIAGAITLAHHPWFWLNVDGHTAGPMDVYYLALPSLWGGAIDYTTARATGLVLIFGILFFCYRTFRLQFAPATARVALIPLVVFFAWVTDEDFVEISTEHMPVFLLTAGSYFFLRSIFTEAKRSRSWIVAGLILGLAPWAKLQSSTFVVGALLTAVVWCGYASPRPKSFASFFQLIRPFVTGLALPSALFGLLMVSTGQVFSFYQSYLAANLDYVYRGTAKYYLLSELWFFSCESGFFPLLFLGTALWALANHWWKKDHPRTSRMKWFLGYALLSFFTVISPGRPFLHYLLFMVPPLGLLAGCGWSEWFEDSVGSAPSSGLSRPYAQTKTWVYVAPWLIGFVFLRSLFPPPFQGSLEREWHRPLSRPAALTRPYLKSGDTIALWGWRPDVYVELQTPQAVRDGHTQREMEDTPFRPYYRQRYLADLRRNQPVAFIDVVGPDAFVFLDRKRFGFETFPELAAYVTGAYREVDDSRLGRVFIRKDRIQAH